MQRLGLAVGMHDATTPKTRRQRLQNLNAVQNLSAHQRLTVKRCSEIHPVSLQLHSFKTAFSSPSPSSRQQLLNQRYVLERPLRDLWSAGEDSSHVAQQLVRRGISSPLTPLHPSSEHIRSREGLLKLGDLEQNVDKRSLQLKMPKTTGKARHVEGRGTAELVYDGCTLYRIPGFHQTSTRPPQPCTLPVEQHLVAT